jgi:uncharacterized membrane protein
MADDREESERISQKSPVNTNSKSTDPTPVAVSLIQDTLKNPNAALAATAFAAVLMLSPFSASAAMSGGRMGGSYSAPRSSYSGRVAPSYSRGYSQGFGSGFGSGYYSRPSVTIAPMVTPYYNPFFNPFGFGGGVVYRGGGGFGFFTPLLFGLGALAFFNIVPTLLRGGMQATSQSWLEDTATTSVLGPGTSVVQVSVALEVPNRDDPGSILSALNRISRTARTDSRVGIQNLTSQVALELLRRKSSIVSASTRSKHFRDRQKAERDFNQVSVKERSKFEQETTSKFGGVDYSAGDRDRLPGTGVDGKATMAVVTIVMAIDGDSTQLGQIRSMTDLENALQKIASDAKVEDCLQSVEILWTPEDRSETLTLRDIVADYPELRTI